MGVAFATGFHQVRHRPRGVAIEGVVSRERKRHRSGRDVALHGHMTHASEDRPRHDPSHVEQREIQSVNGQVLRADIEQWDVI